MPVEKTVPMEGASDWVWDIFPTTPIMSTYLIAFAIQDYEGVKGDHNVTIWANKDDVEAGMADFISDVAPRYLDFFTSMFGIEYVLPKMDMVACPAR